MSTRTTGPNSTYGAADYWYLNSNSSGPQFHFRRDPTLQSYFYWSTSGEDTPAFHEKIRKGVFMPHKAYSSYKISLENTGSGRSFQKNEGNVGTYRRYSTGEVQHYIGLVPDPLSRASLATLEDIAFEHASLADDLIRKSLESIYLDRFDILTFSAELRKTIALFQNLVYRFLRYLRSGQIDKIWLEGRYGWRTFVFDIQELNKLLSNPIRRWVDFTKSSNEDVNSSSTDSGSKSVIEGTKFAENTISDNVSVRGVVGLRADLNIVLANPILTAWELVPWSFVLDWFIDIGRSIAALSASFVATYSTTSRAFHVHRTVQHYSYVGTNEDWSGDDVYQSLTTASLKLRVPVPPDYLPIFNVNLNVYKILDLIALLLQFRR